MNIGIRLLLVIKNRNNCVKRSVLVVKIETSKKKSKKEIIRTSNKIEERSNCRKYKDRNRKNKIKKSILVRKVIECVIREI